MDLEILETSIIAAVEAGREILEIYNDPNSDFQIERKADNSPLTIADKRSQEKIVSFLNNFDIPTISEEADVASYKQRKEWTKMWIIDPLDGTKEFIKKNGDFTVNIALVEGNEPTMGVIYLPVADTLYFGEKSLGAFRLDNALNTYKDSLKNIISSSRKMPFTKSEKYSVVASRSHMSPDTEAFLAKLESENGELEIVSRGSSIKICLVAEGSADIYPRFSPTMEWDTAAGDAIARAAGKMVYFEDGVTHFTYNKESLLNPYFIVK